MELTDESATRGEQIDTAASTGTSVDDHAAGGAVDRADAGALNGGETGGGGVTDATYSSTDVSDYVPQAPQEAGTQTVEEVAADAVNNTEAFAPSASDNVAEVSQEEAADIFRDISSEG